MENLEEAIKQGQVPWTTSELETDSYVVYKNVPQVTPGHMAIVPRQNDNKSILKCFNYALNMGQNNVESDNDVTGYTIAMNVGESTGQQVSYPFVTILMYRKD